MTYKEYCKTTFGYDTISTFWEDFTIAEQFGAEAINDTYNRAFNGWKHDYKMITELVLVLNHKIWSHYNHGECSVREEKLAKIYDELWGKLDNWCCNNLKDEALSYYCRTTD